MGIIKRPDHIERHKYACHKSKAKQRGIPFELTYEEWWKIWQESGKWEQRGCKKDGYVMSRFNDQGPYSIDNVFIQLHSDNTKEACIGLKIPRTKEHQDKLTASIKKYNAENPGIQKGRKMSEQTRLNNSIAQKESWAKRKNKQI